jgi:hypothetical protein
MDHPDLFLAPGPEALKEYQWEAAIQENARRSPFNQMLIRLYEGSIIAQLNLAEMIAMFGDRGDIP